MGYTEAHTHVHVHDWCRHNQSNTHQPMWVVFESVSGCTCV